MSGERNMDVWNVLRPSKWPGAPPWMSFSTLSDLEVCPRRWALSLAEYPHVWNESGYPRPLRPAAIEGTVVHLSLQRVMAALVDRGCPSLSHESASGALRELGGYTAIVMSSLKRALQPYEGNPRAAAVLEGIRHRFAARVPELRSRVQRFLVRIDPECGTGKSAKTMSHPESESRRRLLHGSYGEVELRAGYMGWHGIVDLLTIASTRCEIRDFKTGEAKEEHEYQLQVYALLWARDRDLNPDGRLADRLVLSYDEGDVSVRAPSEKELRQLEHALATRTAQALADLQVDPPEARPTRENCAYCAVRHLCEDYWPWHAREGPSNESARTGFGDVQIRLSGQHGPTSWDGMVELGPGLRKGRPILLRTGNHVFDHQPGQRVRLLNVYMNIPGEEPDDDDRPDPTVVATMGASSEAFFLTT